MSISFVIVRRCMTDSEWDVPEMGWCGQIFVMIHTSLTLLNYRVSAITFVMFERTTVRGFSNAIYEQPIQTAAGARLWHTRVSTKGFLCVSLSLYMNLLSLSALKTSGLMYTHTHTSECVRAWSCLLSSTASWQPFLMLIQVIMYV